jgi:Cu(I)/Ag(I) efflux system protein CusF
MKKILICVFLSILSATTMVYANDAHYQTTDNQKSYTSKGEVVAVSTASRKIKLKHEAIPELKWPAMTMFFKVADKALPDTVKVGDQVEFELVKIDGGGTLITKIRAIK